MRIDILSLFPDMFDATLGQSIVGRAQDDGFVDIKVTDLLITYAYTSLRSNNYQDIVNKIYSATN